ncbi:sensor histidine kinase [Paenibacillus sp. GCM10027626]|uniref:sensor histidine kinase n=1 Tax=Paenibacillus sp. GCM10027626 TaxID=3273411 RepID=UPI00362BA27A
MKVPLFPKTLKNRLIVLLLLCSLFPLVVIGSITHTSMYDMLKNKAEKGITNNLHNVRLSFENTLSQLNHASQQLVFEGRIGNKLNEYLTTSNLFEKKKLYQEIESEISLIHFTNPSLGLIFYYQTETDEILFKNSHIRDDFNIFELPLLAEQLTFTYYGPHISLNPLDGYKVLSVVRKVEFPQRDDVYLYMETDFKLTDRILNTDDMIKDTFYFFVDTNNRIAYSENQEDFPAGSLMTDTLDDARSDKGYYLFEELSTQSWRIVAAVSKQSYEKEINNWIAKFVFFAALSLVVSCLLAFMIWRMIYSPLLHLQKNIRRLKNGRMTELPGLKKDVAQEFAEIHQEFSTMRVRIDELIRDIDENAEIKRQLEIENLLYKINPHFIHNTLDTIRWLARVNGQDETDRLVSTLNRLLHYNLGKGQLAPIEEEIAALKNYVTLQGVRYNFQFDVQIQADAELLKLSVPRFILQPLVENSISHGLKTKSSEQGVIEVFVRKESSTHFTIGVRDNGYGMTEEEVARMLSGESVASRTGMGIGWKYVRRMLELNFPGTSSMDIQSSLGQGTLITLTLPIIEQEGDQLC